MVPLLPEQRIFLVPDAESGWLLGEALVKVQRCRAMVELRDSVAKVVKAVGEKIDAAGRRPDTHAWTFVPQINLAYLRM